MLGADHSGYVGRYKALVAAAGDDPADPPGDPDRPAGQPAARRRAGPDEQAGRQRRQPRATWSRRSASTPPATRWPGRRSTSRSTSTSTCGAGRPTTTRSSTSSTRTPGSPRCCATRPTSGSAARRAPDDVDAGQLAHDRENDLLRAIGEFPRVLTGAAELRAPHRVARYLEELAGTYHRFYDSCRVLPRGDEEATPLTTARLWLCAATAVVLRNGLPCSACHRLRSGCESAPGGAAARQHHAADRGRRAAGGPRRARPARLAPLGAAGRRRAAPRRPCRSPSSPATHGTPLFVLDEARLPRPGGRLRRRLRPTPTSTTRRRRSSAARWPAGSPTTACTSTPAAATSSPLALAAGFPAGADRAARQQQVAASSCSWRSTPASATSCSTPSTRSTGSSRWPPPGWPPAARRCPVLIRATVGIEAHTHEFIATAHEDQKFGFSLATGDALTAAVRVIREPAPAADRAAQPHRLADLRHRRLRGRRAPGGRSARPGRARRPASCSASSTSAAASASPTCPRTTRSAPADVAARLRTVVAAECAALGPARAAPGGRARPRDRRPRHRHALRDRHDQAGAAGCRAAPRAPRWCATTSPSTAG